MCAVHASLATELQRLEEDNALLRERCTRYEADVGALVDASSLGHSNPKQKLQYHLRYAGSRMSVPMDRSPNSMMFLEADILITAAIPVDDSRACERPCMSAGCVDLAVVELAGAA